MPALLDTIRSEMTTAMRQRDTQRRDTLRLLIAALDNARIAAGRELSDDDAIVALQREAKQRRESIEEYRKGSRDDLVEASRRNSSSSRRTCPASSARTGCAPWRRR